jgi:hypothetical protein
MRILVDRPSNEILQVERSPDIGDAEPINGKYVLEAPAGQVVIDTSSYVLPVDGGDFMSLGYAELLARFPMYDNIVFNPLVQDSDVGDLDFTALLDNTTNQVLPGPYTGTFGVRAQTGRELGSQKGLAPNSTTILPPNLTTTPPRPGLLITDQIDISAATGGAGATEFMVYWKVYGFNVSHDIMSSFGIFAGVNQPAIRSIEEIEQEPTGLVVAISLDDNDYVPVGRLEPVNFCLPGTLVRLAFTNTSSNKIYLATYALMF